MPRVAREFLDTFHTGVVCPADAVYPSTDAALGADQLVASSTPRAWNNAMAIMANRAVPRKRDGCVTMNRSPLSTAEIRGQYAYRYRNSDGTVTQYHLLAKADGRLERMSTSGTETSISTTAFTVGAAYPDFATLNNLCFIVNGTDKFKLNDTTKQTFGIVRPVVGTMKGYGQGTGDLDGVFELRVTYVNSVTGHESSASDSATDYVSAANQSIYIENIPVSSDAQVDTKYIYIRDTNYSKNFYKVAEIANATTTATVNAVYTTLTTVGPNTNENDPPPSGIKYVAAHKNRLFVADDTKLYWSKNGKPEAFDPDAYDFVHQDDGQKVTGLASIPSDAGNILIIFKEDSYYVLDGDDPQTWAISRIGPAVGCLTHRSIVNGVDGLYWWADQGPVLWRFNTGGPELIGLQRIDGRLTRLEVNYLLRTNICGVLDLTNQRVMWAMPDAAQPRNTKMLVWNSRLDSWESDKWDPIDVASLCLVNDAQSFPYVMIGGYAGQVFKLGVGDNDGVAAGTLTGTFTAGATYITSITDGTATFDTTGSGLAERKITLLDSTNTVVTPNVRPRVASNTATALTLASAIGPLTNGAVYTYIVGGPDWQFDTAWRDLGEPFDKKRLEFAYTLGLFNGNTVYLDIHRNQREFTGTISRLDTLTSSSALWDVAVWDVDLWDDTDLVYARTRGGMTGVTFALRYRQPFANQPVLLLRCGLRAEMQNDKLG